VSYYFNGQYWVALDPELEEGTYIMSMEIDLANNLWLGTTRGLYKYDGLGWTGFFNDSISGGAISNITIDAMNNLMFLKNGEDILKFDGSETSSVVGFENLTGIINFDNKGFAWCNNGSVILRNAMSEPYLKLPLKYIIFDEENFEMNFKLISANTQWTISANEYWIYFQNEMQGQGNENILISAEPSYMHEISEATIEVSGDGIYTQQIKVYQKNSGDVTSADNCNNGVFKLINFQNYYNVEGDNFLHMEIYAVNGVKVSDLTEPFIYKTDFNGGVYLVKIYSSEGSFETHKIAILN